MQAVTKNPIEQIYCQQIPLRQLRLLVPRVCVAEEIRFAPLERPWPGPAWLRGFVNWATLKIRVISFEELCGRSAGEPGGRTRIAILNAVSGKLDSGYYGVLTGGFPQLVRVNGGSGDMIDEVRTSDEARYTGSTYTVPTSEFTLGPTVNIDSKTAEFGREVDTPIVSRWLTPNSAESDSEIGDVGAVFTQADLQSEYDYESGSPAVSLVYVVGTSTYERDWEISLTQDAVPGSMEFGWEGKSTGIPTDYFIGSNRTPMERVWESSSPGLSSRGFLRGVTPIRRRIIAGRASIDRRTDPQYRVDIDPSRRTEIVRVLR